MDVTLPNGTVIRDIPDDTPRSAIAFKAIMNGLAKPEDFGQQSSAGPAEGMSGFEKFRAGWGKATADLGRGIAQAAESGIFGIEPAIAAKVTGFGNQGAIAESRGRDAPLMQTGAGKAGNISGAVANTLPTAFLPGANTVAGATAIGAGLGALQPSTSATEKATSAAVGGALGAGGLLAGRGISAGYRGLKATIEPFTKGGQERIAARALQAFAGTADDAARASQNIEQGLAGPLLEGVEPTAAELAKNPGIAQLERTIRNNPEYLTQLADRLQVNKEAIMSALDDMAGTPAAMEAAKTARSGATNALYDSAKSEMVSVDDTLRTLLKRPSMQIARQRAENLAAENGELFVMAHDVATGRSLHYLKMAIDDLADNPAASGIGGNEARALNSTRKSLVDWIGKAIPDYDAARSTYSAMSQPINQMEVGQAFRNKLQPALADYGASSRMRSASFAEALRSGDDFAANTLGRSTAKLGDIMDPGQMEKLKLIAEQLGRRANADELGRAVGSNTAQNLVSQNIVRQILGPLGLPESTIQRAAESTLLQSVLRPAQFAGQLGEQRAMAALAKAALDPKMAAEMLKVGIDPKSIGLLIRNQQFIAPALVSGTNAARQ